MKPGVRHIVSLVGVLVFSTSLILANGTTITILHVNDTHSHLDAFGPKDIHLNGTLGGIAKAATVIGAVRATESNVLLLHAGDVFHGDFFFNTYAGVPEFQLLKGLGLDAMAIGNHEFDGGPGPLAGALNAAFPGGPESAFPLLAANVRIPTENPLKPWVTSDSLFTRFGLKIGIFGMTIPGEPTSNPGPVDVVANIDSVAEAAAKGLTSKGAQLVICLSHLGSAYDQAMAANVSGIDLIVGGHDQILLDHPISVTNKSGTQTLIVQAGEFYKYVGKATITVDDGKVSLKEYKLLAVDRSIPREPNIQSVVDELKRGIVAKYGDVYHTLIGTASKELGRNYDAKSRFRDTPLGNLVTDACRKKGVTNISIAVLGFISEKIYAGPIVGADVFRTMSYGFDESSGLGFKLVKVRITGTNLTKALEAALFYVGESDDFFLQVSGMTYTYDARKEPGKRVTPKSIRVNGHPLNPNAKYTVTVNEGIAAMLPTMGVEATDVEPMADFEYNVVKDYIKHLRYVSCRPEGRIIDMGVLSRHGAASKNEGAKQRH